MGHHLCLGAELARIEARIALSALFARYPAMRLAVEAERLRPLPSLISNGHEQVPVVLGPTAALPSVSTHYRKCPMPTKIRTAAALTQLTPAEKRVAELLVTGVSNVQGARALGMSTHAFTSHLGNIGRKFNLTGRPVRAHAVLASGQVAPPLAPADVPSFTPKERLLLRAVAEHPNAHDIACAAGIPPGEVRPRIKDLVAKAGAENDTHLIGLGHAWGLLVAGTIDGGTVGGAPEVSVGAAR